MDIGLELSCLALGPVVEGLCQMAGAAAGESVLNVATLLAKRFTDQSAHLTRALEKANERAWKALEIALAGDSFWSRCQVRLASGEEKAFRVEVLGFLDVLPTESLPQNKDAFRRECWQELRRARKAGVLSAGSLSAKHLTDRAGDFARFGDPKQVLRSQQETLARMGQTLRKAGYPTLAQLLALRDGPSLLVLAARYFFRRAVEEDVQLFQGLAFAQLEQVQAGQEQGFAVLTRLLNEHGERLESLLDDLAETVAQTHEAVLDVRQELRQQGEQNRELYQAVLQLQQRFDLMRTSLRPSDSLSIRDEAERKLVRAVVERYRRLPEDQRRRQPALLNAIGQLEVAAGAFEAAGRDFAALAELVAEPSACAEAHANAYRAALEQRNWPLAQHELLQAIELDAARFAPFPPDKYRLIHILGAGGSGVAFLCEDKQRKDKVVVKTLLDDGLACGIEQLFTEASVLRKLDHPGVVRLRGCGYADPGSRCRPYLVMDYFEGVTLEAYIEEQGSLSFGEWLAVARQMAEALRIAHQEKVLHRDVKPANVLVRKGRDGLRVQLIDFGLALRQDALRDSMKCNSTLVGASIAGTLDYAAPEQLGRLPGVQPGPYSDIYGFGRTCCFALFQTTQPSLKHWTSVPRAIADLLGRCLGEKPEDRPPNFTEVLRGLYEVQCDLRTRFVLQGVTESAPTETPPTAASPPRPVRKPRPAEVVRAEEPHESEPEPKSIFQTVPLWLWGMVGFGALLLFVGSAVLVGVLLSRATQAGAPGAVAASGPSGPRVPQLAVSDPEERKVYLSDLPEMEVGSFPILWSFGKNGHINGPSSSLIAVESKTYAKALGMHPPQNSYSMVKYRIEPAEVFQALAGMDDSAAPTLGGDYYFEVLGDGRSLWKSKPVRDRGAFQDARVNVANVKVLELRVHAPPAASNHGGHAVWLDPYITRPADYRAPADTKPSERTTASQPSEKLGDWVSLSDLPEMETGPFPGGWRFGKNGDAGDGSKIKVEGKEYPKGIGMHPPGGNQACSVKYRLDSRAVSLEATVALSEGFWAPASDVIFEVLGDGKSLWKSKPVNRGRRDHCEVNLKGVRVLELRTSCGAPTGCHAVWLDPIVRLVAADKSKGNNPANSGAKPSP
jgi:serine/threonine protein kinase